MSCSNGEKKIPNKVLTHMVMDSLYAPIFYYLGFLKILHGIGDLVSQVGGSAVLGTAQMQVFFALSATIFMQVKPKVLFTSRVIAIR